MVHVGQSGRGRSDTRGRDLSARDSIHSKTLGSVCIANRLVRRSPRCDVLTARDSSRGQIVRAKPARCIGNPISLFLQFLETFMTTREHPADVDRQTTPSCIPNGARWLGAPTCSSVTVLTPQSVIWGVGQLEVDG